MRKSRFLVTTRFFCLKCISQTKPLSELKQPLEIVCGTHSVFFRKTMEILGKIRRRENKISVDFFLAKKFTVIFLIQNIDIPDKSSRTFHRGKLEFNFFKLKNLKKHEFRFLQA